MKLLKPHNLRPIFPTNQSPFFSSLTQPNIPTDPPLITHQSLLSSIQSSQWHFIEPLRPNISFFLISNVLSDLHKSPKLVLEFISHIEFHRLDIQTRCLGIAIVAHQASPIPTLELLKQLVGSGTASIREIFDSLVIARERLSVKSCIIFDFLGRACCEMKRADEALDCFHMMKDTGIMPKTETCNDLLSLYLKSNRTERAWVLYAEMFRLRIKSSVCTFNLMIDVLCKEGKGVFGVYGELVGGALMIFSAMKAKGIEPDSYTYGSLISGMCKERRLDEASGLFDKMLEIGLLPNAVTCNTLIDSCCNKGDLDRALSYRDDMVKKGIMSTVSTYNLLIHDLFMECKAEEAGDMIKEMEEKGIVPDSITYNILINGYCRSGNAKKAFSLHDEILEKG